MAAFFIVNIEIPSKEDRKSYDEYIAKVKPIVESYGGNYIVRSEQVSLFAGEKIIHGGKTCFKSAISLKTKSTA